MFDVRLVTWSADGNITASSQGNVVTFLMKTQQILEPSVNESVMKAANCW